MPWYRELCSRVPDVDVVSDFQYAFTTIISDGQLGDWPWFLRPSIIFDFAVCNYIFCHILHVVHFFCSFFVCFSLHLQYARVFKNAKFFADYFLVSAFSQEPDKTKWTVEESNLWRAGLQPAALPSELTVQIRRCKIAFSYFSPFFLFSASGCLFRQHQ